MSDVEKPSSTSNFSIKKSLALFFLAFIVKRTIDAGDPVYYIIPNALMYTPFKGALYQCWKYMDPWQRLNKEHVPTHVPILTPEEFNMESLKKATQNFKHPVLVRGLYKDTPAVKNWGKKGYLAEKFGKFYMPYIDKATYGTYQDDRTEDYFAPIFEEIRSDPNSQKYLFFPVLSRFQHEGKESGSLEELTNVTNKVVHDELMLSEKIWNGFATDTERHVGFKNSQLIIGRGTKDMNTTTGTGLHAEPGHNWFSQVVGKKRWYLMEQKYSSLMKPMRGGIVNMQTGSLRTHDEEVFKRFPLQYADTLPGDLLYSPDWYWHTVKNYEGFNIGCPIRELNVSIGFQNNAAYMGAIVVNKIVEKLFGFDMGGYPTAEDVAMDAKEKTILPPLV